MVSAKWRTQLQDHSAMVHVPLRRANLCSMVYGCNWTMQRLWVCGWNATPCQVWWRATIWQIELTDPAQTFWCGLHYAKLESGVVKKCVVFEQYLGCTMTQEAEKTTMLGLAQNLRRSSHSGHLYSICKLIGNLSSSLRELQTSHTDYVALWWVQAQWLLSNDAVDQQYDS